MSRSIEDIYDKAADDRYSRIESRIFTKPYYNHISRFRHIKNAIKKAKVSLDLGTGTGIWAEVLSQYSKKVIAVDFSKECINRARVSQAEKRLTNIEYRILNLETVNKQIPADQILSISVLQHLKDQQKFIDYAYRSLNDKGRFIILVHNRLCIYNRSMKYSAFDDNKYNSLKEIREMVKKSGFKISYVKRNWHFLNDIAFIGHTKFLLQPLRRFVCGMIRGIERRDNNPSHYREFLIVAEK